MINLIGVSYKKFFLIFLILPLCLSPVLAQDSVAEIGDFSRGEVQLYGGIPYITTYLVTLPALFLPYGTSKFISAGTLLAGGIPSAIIDPVDGLTSMGIGALGIGASFYVDTLEDSLYKELFRGPLLNIGQKTQMWSYYTGYQNARLRASSGEYPDVSNFRKETFLSMAAAPWKLGNISRTSVWLPVVTVTGAKILVEALSTGGKNAIWTTGKAYLGQTEVPVFVGILVNLAISIVNYSFTAIGEEGVFRGIGYEEMKISMGQPGAFLADCTLFAGIHVPYEFQQGKTGSQLAFNYATRFGTTFFLDWAYDDGGLQASVAEHLWLDVAMAMVGYLFNAGVPH